MHKIIRSVLRFILHHKRVYKVFEKYKWFNELMYDEAQRIIGNR